MAQHVLSIGMSHSTLVILDDSLWGEWAAQDAALAILFAQPRLDGYIVLLDEKGPRIVADGLFISPTRIDM